MNGTGQRAARTALDAARSSVEQLERAPSPEDAAASLIEAWSAAEQALQAMAGTTALTGQPLLRELRQRDLLTLGQAHTLIDFGSLAERARAADYSLTSRDRDTARAGMNELEQVVERAGPVNARSSATPPRAAEAPVPDGVVLAHGPTSTRSANLMGRAIAAVAVVAILGGAAYAVYALRGRPDELARGRAAYAAGDHLTARSVFEAAAIEHPALAEPHLYLGRIARQAGNLPLANEELRRAISLEPSNYLGHRELGALLLLTQRPDLARSFYERAIRLNPEDKTSLGYMGCTLIQLGRADLAQRFLARAGAGPWTACVPLAPPPSALPPALPR